MKTKTLYICNNCAYETSQWVGQCPNCSQWNTFIEEIVDVKPKSAAARTLGKSPSKVAPVKLSEVISNPPKRLNTGIGEFDRVLGGGFVPGQVVLLTGEPGIGKSTILTEIARSLKGKKILYVCGEESIDQIKVRALRMQYQADNLLMYPETEVESITSFMEDNKDASLVIIDSVQTIYSAEIMGISGSMTQVRGCTQLLTNVTKRLGMPLILVGHITKEGVVAGPKILEHIVDTVLYLEGDSQHMFRILRTTKNRFGPVSEAGIFEMVEEGIKEVSNPSEMFLEQRSDNAAGSCVTVVMEGYRPLLFEVQALTVKTAFGYPRRTTSGFNANRLQVLIAILEKSCGLNLSSYDVYLNIAGGFKVTEYAADLAVCMAIASAVKEKPINPKTVVYGECGLNGEIRRVTYQDKRSKEAKKLGYTHIVSPEECKSLAQALKMAF
jgi:DNA repair protein RadA/Sms